MKKIAILLLVAFILPACDDDHQTISVDAKYFPLHIGDSWEFVSYNWHGQPTPGMKREITATVTFNERQYYVMTTHYIGGHTGHVDTAYYRVDHRGYVYERRKDQDHEINPFRLKTSDGTSWKDASYISAEGLMTLHQFTTVNLDQTAVDNCKVFSYDEESFADEEYYVTLAPGLGVVTEGSYAWGQRFDLKKAVINGKTFEF
jgi:hypothetical protein